MGKSQQSQLQSLTSALEALSASAASPKALSDSSDNLSVPGLDSSFTTRTPSVSVPTPGAADLDTIDQNPWFGLITTKDRGLSLIAVRRIPAGTLIFFEPPIIKISSADETNGSAIDRAFEALSKRQSKQYLQLFNAKNSQTNLVTGIYNSNCYDIKAFDDAGGSCIGATSSRLNHSCLPNVAFSYLPAESISIDLLHGMPNPEQATALKRGLIQVHAIKSISKGKELVSNYEKNIFAPHRTRIERLRRHYGFDCTCEACLPQSAFWERSDARRKRMDECIRVGAQLDKEWLKLSGESQAGSRVSRDGEGLRIICDRAIAVLSELESLLIKEGLTYTPLANCYRSLAKWSSRCNEDVVPWTQKELEVIARCLGKDSKRAQMLVKVVGA